ncbi:hypothetical protein HY468_02755 [Candidatus Roizmanbacteria bacterium]|nr:hypothetical protein [Candidatus Roizmanbacteria bacterium]
MSQVSKYPIRDEVYGQLEDLFVDTISRMTNKRLVNNFLNDFLTPTEKIVLMKRLGIYVLLGKGYDYRVIQNILRVSFPTISSASRSYKYLRKGCKVVVDQLVQGEKIDRFITSLLVKVTGEFSSSGKGSGVWRYLHNEIKKKDTKILK